MAYYGIIPARYASTRLPAKALADIAGKPMFWHVYNQAKKCTALEAVYLATDDTRIYEVAQSLGVAVLMTSKDHQSGTDRVYEAACALDLPADSVVVNIQGDEPCLDPCMLEQLISPFVDAEVEVSTLACAIDFERAKLDSQVKVVCDTNNYGIYFSRSLIPYNREGQELEYLGHIGLYAFRLSSLQKFVNLNISQLERIEKLEQLRLIENGIKIKVVKTTLQSFGVDTDDDLELIRKKISEVL